MQIVLPDPVQAIIDRLQAHGFQAYVVGGCVRDALLHKMPSDWDLCTDATPRAICALFSEYHCLTAGIKHGTVGVVIERKPYEITTFRTEEGYLDNRHPDRVTFVGDLVADLARRDFTINAIAYCPSRGLIDPFGGREDLRQKLVRCVRDPKERFQEDALRILRALRFSSTLCFDIEPETSATIHAYIPLLQSLSKERITVELQKLLLGKNCAAVIEAYADVICSVLSGASAATLAKTRPAMEEAPANLAVRLAILFGTCDPVGSLRALRFDTKTAAAAACAARFQKQPLPCDPVSLKNLLRQYKETAFVIADVNQVHFPTTPPLREQLSQILQSGACYCLRQLAVSGADLQQRGFAGKQIGDCLDALLDAVICGYPNEREALLLLAGERKN